MNRQDHLLVILAEECSEVAHRVAKGLRFGVQEIQPDQTFTNGQRIYRELADLLAVWGMLEDEGILESSSSTLTRHLVHVKRLKVEEYLRYSESIGRVDGPTGFIAPYERTCDECRQGDHSKCSGARCCMCVHCVHP